jgi:hypothetical protein
MEGIKEWRRPRTHHRSKFAGLQCGTASPAEIRRKGERRSAWSLSNSQGTRTEILCSSSKTLAQRACSDIAERLVGSKGAGSGVSAMAFGSARPLTSHRREAPSRTAVRMRSAPPIGLVHRSRERRYIPVGKPADFAWRPYGWRSESAGLHLLPAWTRSSRGTGSCAGNFSNCLHARAKRVAPRSLVKLHDATTRLDRLERQSVLAAEDARRPRGVALADPAVRLGQVEKRPHAFGGTV